MANRWWSVAGWALCALAVSYGPTVVVSSFIGIGAHALHLEQPKWVLQVVNAFFTRVYSAAVMPALSVAAYYQLHVSSGRELPPMKWVTRARRRFERG